MQTAIIGSWQVSVPDGWIQKDQCIGVPYLEAPDGTRGVYFKTVEVEEPFASSSALASHIQAIHRRSFESAADSHWRVVDARELQDRGLCRSALDLLDQNSSYRILSLVVSDTRLALHVTLHDYLCEDYPSVRDEFNAIEQSIANAAHAA